MASHGATPASAGERGLVLLLAAFRLLGRMLAAGTARLLSAALFGPGMAPQGIEKTRFAPGNGRLSGTAVRKFPGPADAAGSDDAPLAAIPASGGPAGCNWRHKTLKRLDSAMERAERRRLAARARSLAPGRRVHPSMSVVTCAATERASASRS